MATANVVSRLVISEEVGNVYDRLLVERLIPNIVFTNFGQIRDIPRKAGSLDVRFRNYNSLTASTTALGEGTTPTGSSLAITDVNATIAQYGRQNLIAVLKSSLNNLENLHYAYAF